jgi:hypothetical protein
MPLTEHYIRRNREALERRARGSELEQARKRPDPRNGSEGDAAGA